MRALAIDLGDKRTGVAVGDDETGLVTPRQVIERRASPPELLIADLVRIVADEEPDVVVLGLPLNMDGSVGPRAELVRRFVAALRTALTAAATRGGRTPAVVFVDERLTSAEAEWQLAGSGLTRGQKKKRRDALAAAAILRSYFAEGPWGDEATGRNAPGEDSADVGDD